MAKTINAPIQRSSFILQRVEGFWPKAYPEPKGNLTVVRPDNMDFDNGLKKIGFTIVVTTGHKREYL